VPGPEGQAWLARTRAEHLRLRWLAGDAVEPDELVGAWTASTAAFDAYGHVYEAARSRARLATALHAVGDHAGAGREAGSALETARRLGARPLVDEVRPLADARAGAAGPGTEVLTPREAEVLALVADGASNREVGQRLFISTKTASVHVSNILAKLGARSRTEAVSLARRRGLLG
jgi:DNA-binding CsgD family transcriptional regulator